MTGRRSPSRAKGSRAFSANLWKWSGKGGWFFVNVPEDRAPPAAGAWGRVPVIARLDGVEWPTSVWRDRRHGWLLPVPAKIRGARAEGDSVIVEIAPDAGRPV